MLLICIMLLFLDTAAISEIKKWESLIDGVTTTPTIIKKAGTEVLDFMSQVRQQFPSLEIHIEALGPDPSDTQRIIQQYVGSDWYDPDKVVFKVPISHLGLSLTRALKRESPHLRINTHLIFSPSQALLAMLANSDYITPLIGRYTHEVAKESPQDRYAAHPTPGHALLEDIISIKRSTESSSLVLASSLRTVDDFNSAILLNADAATVSPDILETSLQHKLTDKGVRIFLDDLATHPEM